MRECSSCVCLVEVGYIVSPNPYNKCPIVIIDIRLLLRQTYLAARWRPYAVLSE